MKSRALLSFLLLLAVMLTSCHSSRRTSRADSQQHAEKTLSRIHDEKHPESPSQQGAEIVKEARKWLGTKYKYGGQSHKGTDCSGMVMQVYLSSTGLKLPRDSRSQQNHCHRIKVDDLMPGDLVFFASKAGGSRVGHVGIYSGAGKFIHASSSRGVIESRLEENYYTRHFHSAGRVPGAKTDVKAKKHHTESKKNRTEEKPRKKSEQPRPTPRPTPEPTPVPTVVPEPTETRPAPEPTPVPTVVPEPTEPRPTPEPTPVPTVVHEPTETRPAPEPTRKQRPERIDTLDRVVPAPTTTLDSLLRAGNDNLKQPLPLPTQRPAASDSISADSIRTQVRRAMF